MAGQLTQKVMRLADMQEPVAGTDERAQLARGLHAVQGAVANPGMGEPLSQSDRSAMGARFGYDFSQVRIHTGSEAARAARAKAFTSGQHIWFGPGRGPAGNTLLAHELAHVVQQATGEASLLADRPLDVAHREWLEGRAERGNVQASPDTSRMGSPVVASSQTAIIQFDFEEDVLSELIRLPAAEEEGIAEPERRQRVQVLAGRVERLFVLFSSLSGTKADEIYERLRERRKGDLLSERFHDILSTPTRKMLLASIGLKGYAARQVIPDPADFCRPFSKREIDQGIDFDMANAMDRFVNGDMRDFWGDETADLYDAYLTSTAKNVTPRIFDRPGSELVQGFINHPATANRQRELAAIIEKNLPDNCGHLPANEWVDFSPGAIIPPADLKAPFSFGDFKTIPAIVAGGVSPGPDAPESRTLSKKQVMLRRNESGGTTTGLRMRVQFHFVVQDSIDFCPGGMGGFLASYVTIPFSRLEASGQAFRVPFQVHYDGPVLELELGAAAAKACT